MFRKLLALIALAVVVWLGARYFAHRGDVKATIVFHEAGALRKGDPVVENDETIGRVTSITPLEGQDAVGIRLDRGHRRAVVTDSMFAIDDRRIVVTNTFAIGKPIADGAVLRVKDDDRFGRWLAKNAAALQPFVDKLKRAADAKLDSLDKELASASAKMPQWKQEGKDAFDKHVAELKAKVEKAEKDLEKTDHKAEARKLREKFDRWLAEVRR
jgi:ABC-type transporter Mla subunit MlaD